MNCTHGTCLQETLGQRLIRHLSQFLQNLAAEIVQATTRRQHYLELRTRAIHYALAQRVCCRNLLAKDASDLAGMKTCDE